MDFAIARGGLTLTDDDLAAFSGIRVIGDVHGAFEAFDRALVDAEREDRFVVQLGDLIDRGPFSTLCVERMLDLEKAGKGIMCLGNHEVAFARFVVGGANGAVTRQATLMEFEEYGGDLLSRFVARVAEGPLWVRYESDVFVHATFVPRMLDEDSGAPDERLVDAAIHGEGDAVKRRELIRSRKWIDKVPEGVTVYVGHHVTDSRCVESQVGRMGGKAFFADTGAWIADGGNFPIVDLLFDAAPARTARFG